MWKHFWWKLFLTFRVMLVEANKLQIKEKQQSSVRVLASVRERRGQESSKVDTCVEFKFLIFLSRESCFCVLSIEFICTLSQVHVWALTKANWYAWDWVQMQFHWYHGSRCKTMVFSYISYQIAKRWPAFYHLVHGILNFTIWKQRLGYLWTFSKIAVKFNRTEKLIKSSNVISTPGKQLLKVAEYEQKQSNKKRAKNVCAQLERAFKMENRREWRLSVNSLCENMYALTRTLA